MKIIVVGCGKVGSTLARQLSEEGHDVSVVDKNQQVVNEVSSSCDVLGIVGNGGSYSVQKDLGVEEADLMIAATTVKSALSVKSWACRSRSTRNMLQPWKLPVCSSSPRP